MMKSAVKRIGVLTSGGDAPGMNAAVRAVYRAAVNFGIDCLGIYRGWNGLINSDVRRLDQNSVSHIINRGGTILYSARSKEFMTEEGQKKAVATCKLFGIEGIVAIGGDGTILRCAEKILSYAFRHQKAPTPIPRSFIRMGYRIAARTFWRMTTEKDMTLWQTMTVSLPLKWNQRDCTGFPSSTARKHLRCLRYPIT